ncbi:MAG TPA: MbtH family NRPS accessory protein [Aquabacterium sp.]|nr:MbtH family NRPS accessory protein [Aquabacterium sp.]
MSDEVDSQSFCVVVNDEEQYSIWPLERDVPAGWRAVGVSGTKAYCTSHIERTWVDMRPLSLRHAMAEASRST